jgi:hypothetical protein
MSVEFVREVHRKYPHLLQQNLGATCHQFTQHVIEHARAKGYEAYHVCKTAGEGQYVPFGFQPRVVKGLDGKDYTITGVSHDAIWFDGYIVDTIAQANDGEHPITHADGRHMEGIPVWNPIPREYWRPNNPPLKSAPVVINPKPIQPRVTKEQAFHLLQQLQAFYQADEGLQRPGGMVIPDAEGRMVADVRALGEWHWQMVVEGVSFEDVKRQIRDSYEWRQKHPNL